MKQLSSRENQLPQLVENYLHKYGLTPWSLHSARQKKFTNVVVVPAIEEFENVKRLLASLIQNDRSYFDETLFLFVVNNLRSSKLSVKSDNSETLSFLAGVINRNQDTRDAGELISSGINIAVVDASSSGLEMPEKDGGVGLARKIGMDLSLTVLDYASPRKKILICLDADCTVGDNYITSIVHSFNQLNIHAAYVPYEHKLPEEHKHKLAIICYEIFLRYYLLGLIYARSPFAFPTIGSTMMCDYESYIKVGGMNKKKAAEDFYFMEKLGKITRVEKISSTKVYPSSRPSWRVPFGTGQRVNRFLKEAHDEYVLYDPRSFVVLKKWIELFYSEKILEAEEYLQQAKSIDNSLHKFLVQNSFDESWNKILRSAKSGEQIHKQKLMWFDGFRTLKLIHFLRDNGYPFINMFDALDKLFVIIGDNCQFKRTDSVPSVEMQLNYLNRLRNLT